MRPTAFDARRLAHVRGFTLLEMIVSIVVMGVLAMAAIPLIQMPASSYVDARRRSELLDQMDLVRNKLAADLQTAVPNSVRVASVGGIYYLEYLEMRASGRYRRSGTEAGGPYCPTLAGPPASCAGTNDALSSNCAETCFTTLGPLNLSSAGVAPVAGVDYVLVSPLDASTALPGNPYLGGANDLKSRLTAYTAHAAQNVWQLNVASHSFPLASSSGRFYVVAQAVSYACNPNAGAGTLTRYWGYAINPVQPTGAALTGLANQAQLSNAVAQRALNCRITYTPTAGAGHGGMVTLNLALSSSSGSANPESVEAALSFAVREP